MTKSKREYQELDQEKSRRRRMTERIVDGFDLLIEAAGAFLRNW